LKSEKEIIQDLSEMKETIKKLQQPQFKSKEKWLDGTDVKQMLHISESTLWRYRKKNMIPFSKIGNKYVYPESYFTKSLVEKMENAHLL
jgi:hypothetical protein